MNKVKPTTKKDIRELEVAFDGNLDLVLFFLKWIEKGQNATQAYLALHPNVDTASAAVLGSKILRKINIQAVMEAYGLGLETYLTQLRDGIEAKKRDQFTGEVEADHKTRAPYHDKLGKLLGIEQEHSNLNLQVNIQPILGSDIKVQ